ncbi:40S ribosomal protein S27 [Conglomerata obtusa]
MIFKDLKNPTREENKQTTKQKRLFQGPNSEFLMVKCGGCDKVSVCFSHSQLVRQCSDCNEIILKPKGGRAVPNDKASLMSADKFFLAKEESS